MTAPTFVTWPNWFKLTITAALGVATTAFAAGQIYEGKTALAAQAAQAAGEASGKVDALAPRVAELEAWRRGEEARAAALAKQVESVASAAANTNAKIDDLARSLHRIEGAVLGAEKPK